MRTASRIFTLRRAAFICLLCIVLVRFFTPLASAQIAKDVPPPSSNFTTIPAGSLVIAMDNTNQSIVAPFNIRAYGLVNNLLQNNIPVMWAIRAGKAKDAVDFTATAQRIAPSTTAATTYNFAGGPFIVHRDFAELARTRITAFGGNVAVYQLTQDVSVDIRYQLTNKPSIAVLDDGGNASIHTTLLNAAGIPNYIVTTAALTTNSCYTFATEPHFDSAAADAQAQGMRNFTQNGGNFLAQCEAVLTYENNVTYGRYQTTGGIVKNNLSTAYTYPNADLSYSQFIGVLPGNPGGSVRDYNLATGSSFQNNGHIHVNNIGASPATYAATASKLYSGAGGMVYYLGGHDYSGSTAIEFVNGQRMYLNAALTPATRPTSCTLDFAATLRTLSGTIYEDANGDGTLSDGVPRSGAGVRLYADANASGIVDTGDTYLAATTTDVSGNYSFQVSPQTSGSNFLVAVDSKSVTPSAGFNSGSSQANVWAEQTYGDDPTTAALDLGARFGGRQGNVSDNYNTATTLVASNAYEHLARVVLSTTNVANVNFGFSFNAVTTLRGGDATDDDTTAARSVQGSLRQFTQNANAVSGANYMRFTPAVAANSGAGWRINVTAALPAITDSSTTIDGTAYSNTNGTSIRDTNTGSLGAGSTGGTVGTDALPLSAVARPELEIVDGGAIAIGFGVQAASTVIRSLAIYGFGNAANSDGNANIHLSAAASNALIEFNIIGASATLFTDPGAAARSGGDNIRSAGADNLIVRDNLIGFSAGKGIGLGNTSTGWLVERNEVRGNGIGNSSLDGIAIENSSGNNTVRGNLFVGNEGVGVDSLQSSGGNTIENNTITGNGVGAGAGIESPGVRLYGTSNIVRRNIINANFGAGVAVTSGSTANTISENSIFANGTITNNASAAASTQIGIDLLAASDSVTVGTSPYVTPNDSGDVDAGGNGLLNFPVLDAAQTSGANLIISGFARPSADIELFIAAPDPRGFGEGQTYLVRLTEGSSADTDATTGTYTSPFASLNVGTDTTNRFRFTILLPAGVSAGTILTATATLAGATSEFSNVFTVSAAPPDVVLVKSVTPDGTQAPGTDLTYTINFTNTGGASATNFIILDPIPANTDFKIGSASADNGSTGLIATIEYSTDSGTSWTAVPTTERGGAPAGYDRALTNVRWRFTGSLSPTAPNNTGNVIFTVRIR